MVVILITFIRLFATAFTVASTVQQIKSIKNKGYRGCINSVLLVLIVGISLWVIYGIGRADIVIVKGKSIGASLNI